MHNRKHWPVIVIGAGPTGLTAANLLTRHGVEVLLVERNASIVREPRAVSIDDESLRTMQSVGIVHEVLQNIVLGYGSEYFSRRGRRFLKVKPTTVEYGYPRRNAFRQPILEAQLRDHLAKSSLATTWFETEICDLSQSQESISVTLRNDRGDDAVVTGEYLISCDGSRSFVRQRLGIDMTGSTFAERWLIIDIEGTTDKGRDTKVYCDPARPCLSLPGPHGTRRFEFMLHDNETESQVLGSDFIAQLLKRYGGDHAATIKRKVVYTFHARMAERWQSGRIFLAGDAAHLMPPFAGQGMNSGIRDAQNLSWKIAAVLKGELGPGLLATYETERREHAAAMIELAVRMGHVMMPKGRLRAIALQTAFRLLALYPAARSYFAEMKYKPKPRFHGGFLIGDGIVRDRSLVGALFPQAIVATGNGFQLLDDALGEGFSMISPPGTAVELLQRASESDLQQLEMRFVVVFGKEEPTFAAPPIVAVRDIRGELQNLLSPYPTGLYLIRPDRYVAGFFPSFKQEAVVDAIKALYATTRKTCAPAL